MKVELETPRLIMRRFMAADAKCLMKMEAEPDVLRYVNRQPLPDLNAYQIRIEAVSLPNEFQSLGCGSWAVIEKADGQFVGACSLRKADQNQFTREMRYGPDDIEIGYAICKPKWGQGIATELVQALVMRAFVPIGTQSVVACVMLENLASIRVLEKNGFKRIGRPLQLPGESEWSVKYRLIRPPVRISGSSTDQRRSRVEQT